jgi:hypothetical protein
VGGSCGTHERGGGVYGVLVGKPEGKRPLRKSRPRLEDNINMDLSERDEMDSAGSGFCEHGNELSGSINKAGYFLTSELLSVFQIISYTMELVSE